MLPVSRVPLSALLALIAAMLLGISTIVKAADIPVPAKLTPEWLADQIKLHGAASVIHELDTKHRYDEVLHQISHGRSEWVALAPKLANGNTDNKLRASIAFALPRNPHAVLAILSPNVLSATEICSAPFDEDTISDFLGYLRQSIKAVEAIDDPKSLDEKFFCLNALNDELAGPRGQAAKTPRDRIPLKLTSKWVGEQISLHGVHSVVERLCDKNLWNEVEDQIGRGRSDWIALVSKLRDGLDGETSEGVTVALALALPKNPRAVLAQIDPGVQDQVCKAPFYYEGTIKNLPRYLRRAIKAVASVKDPNLESRKSLCLEALRTQ